MMQAGHNDSLRAQLAGTNINAETFLATDYLNHFNEVVMLIEMIPDMPECLEDARDWQPKSYTEHFENSGFSDRGLAVQAYQVAPPRYRRPLEEISRRLNDKIAGLLADIEAPVAENNMDDCAMLVEQASQEIKIMIQLASAVINGTSDVTTAAEVEALLAEIGNDNASQGEIDKLF